MRGALAAPGFGLKREVPDIWLTLFYFRTAPKSQRDSMGEQGMHFGVQASAQDILEALRYFERERAGTTQTMRACGLDFGILGETGDVRKE
jgi:hypothetical protein